MQEERQHGAWEYTNTHWTRMPRIREINFRLSNHHRFVNNRSDAYLLQWANRNECGYRFIDCEKDKKPILDNMLLRRHIAGYNLVLAGTERRRVREVMCFDSDSDDGVLNKIGAVLQTLTLQSVREAQRPGRDGHLWLFFGRPVDGGVLIEFGRLVLQWAGLGSNECEVYPKTTKNSQVRAPLGIHRKPGANPMRGCFADAAQGIDAQLVFIAQQPYSRSVVVEELVRKARELTPKEVNRERAFSVDIKTSLELVDIRDYVQARRNGSKEYGQGPACAAENHDRSENNLVVALRRRNGLLLRLRRRRARARERRNSESAWTLAGKGGVVQTAHFAFQKN